MSNTANSRRNQPESLPVFVDSHSYLHSGSGQFSLVWFGAVQAATVYAGLDQFDFGLIGSSVGCLR